MLNSTVTSLDPRSQAQRAANRRTAAVLVMVAAVFFLGIIAKYWFSQ
jgi:hypothetical protein